MVYTQTFTKKKIGLILVLRKLISVENITHNKAVPSEQ